ncbi:hypothetical protein I7N42_03200, partial [Neisseria meningitidis]|nr:hypothetical protein [Neisseria meningitidis]
MPSEAAPPFSDGMKYVNRCLQIDAQRFPRLQSIRRRLHIVARGAKIVRVHDVK